MFATGGAETGRGWFLLQYGDRLLLVSQVVHLAPRHWMALMTSGARMQAVERALHFEQFG